MTITMHEVAQIILGLPDADLPDEVSLWQLMRPGLAKTMSAELVAAGEAARGDAWTDAVRAAARLREKEGNHDAITFTAKSMGVWKLRQGRKVGKTLYLQYGPEPSDDDKLIGYVEDEDFARMIVSACNAGRVRLAVDELGESW